MFSVCISCLSALVCFCTLRLLASLYAECVRVGFGGVKNVSLCLTSVFSPLFLLLFHSPSVKHVITKCSFNSECCIPQPASIAT